jgi:hypothetical protein
MSSYMYWPLKPLIEIDAETQESNLDKMNAEGRTDRETER